MGAEKGGSPGERGGLGLILNGSLGRRNQQEATLLVSLDGPVAEPPEDFFTIHEGFD